MTQTIVNRNTVLVIRPEEMNGLITMEEAVDAVEQGYREASNYPIINAPRRRVHSPDGVRLSNFPGGIPGLGVIGAMSRAESVAHDGTNQEYPVREHPVYLLWDSKTAKLLAIMMGEIFDYRTGYSSNMAFRTGATTGAGVKLLSRKNSKVVGLFGSGGQAFNKMIAIKGCRDIELIKVFSRNPDNRRSFAAKLSSVLKIDVVPVEVPDEVIAGSDIVICATNSNVPVFDGGLLEPGQHVTTIVGSNSQLVEGGWVKEGRRENDDETVRRADIIAVNWKESVFSERQAGLWGPLQAKIINEDKIVNIGDIASGRHPGRTTDDQITYHFNNNGTGAADLAIAKIVYDRARAAGRGIELEIAAAGTQE